MIFVLFSNYFVVLLFLLLFVFLEICKSSNSRDGYAAYNQIKQELRTRKKKNVRQ